MTEADREYFRKFPDHAIRDLLGHPENLRELVGGVAPDLVNGFDFSRMKPVEREFRLEDWRGREADRLFEVPYHEAGMEVAVLVCILVEHQSTPDPIMPLRLLIYSVLYWERQWKDWQSDSTPRESLQLNPVLPIVFHTGNRPWTANRELSQLMGGPEALRAFAPHWPPLFWDITERTPDELLNETGAWLRSLAVVRAERADSQVFLNVFRKLLREIERLTAGNEVRWYDLMRFVISWGLRRRPREEAAEIQDAILESQQQRDHQKQVKTMSEATFKTWDDLLEERVQQSVQQGIQQGIEQGIEQGELRARRAVLKRVLERRFPDVSQDMLDRIEAIEDAARLIDLFDRAIDADSLEELSL